MRRWNRKQKVLRNLLLCVLLGAAAYVLLGFPPYTVGQKLDRLGREYMLEDLEPVYTETVRHRAADQWFGRWYTLVVARSRQGDYVTSSWEQSGLKVERDVWLEQIGRGGICRVWGDQIYAAADGLRGAVSATMEVETKKRTFTLEGKRLEDGVFSFSYLSPDHDYGRFSHGQDIIPDEEIDLLDAVDLWYWEESDMFTYTLFSQDLPCTVTARDEAGQILAEVELSLNVMELDTQELYRW